MRRLSILLSAAVIAFSLGACSAGGPVGAPSVPPGVTIAVTYLVTPARSITPIPTPLPVAADTPAPLPTATELPTPAPPTPVPTQCPAPGDPTPPAKPESFTDVVDALLPYLNAGASITATWQLLASWGVAAGVPSGSGGLTSGVVPAKLLPGDDPQVIVALGEPFALPGGLMAGDLAVFRCAGGTVQLAYHASADPAHAGPLGEVGLLFLEDVTGDGYDDVIFQFADCGAHTCYVTLEILSAADDGTIANIIPGFVPLPYPVFSFSPASGGAARDLLAQIGQIGSIGAGPQRSAVETWSYDGAVYTRTNTIVDSPVYRIHALHDADAAFRRKDFARAGELYQRVAADPGLKAWEGAAPLRDEDQVLGAFARFRLVELAAAQGDAAAAKAAYEALTAAAPEGSQGETYAKLAEVFYTVFLANGDYAQSCDAAARYAEKAANTYILLGTQTFGYANYDYQPRDMCIQAAP